MQLSQCHGHLHRVEACSVFSKPLLNLELSEKFTSPHELHDKVNSQIVLEHVVHANKERVLDAFKQNFLLLDGCIHQVSLEEQIFAERFHGEHFFCVYVLHQVNLAEAASPKDFLDLEIFKLYEFLPLVLEEILSALFNRSFLCETDVKLSDVINVGSIKTLYHAHV